MDKEMQDKFLKIHKALHAKVVPHSVEVDGIHRLIKKSRKGNRYVIYRDLHAIEWSLVALRPHVTMVCRMINGYRTTFNQQIITEYVPQ